MEKILEQKMLLLYLSDIGIDLLSSAVFLVPLLAVLWHTVWRASRVGRRVLETLFCLYLAAVFSVVGLPSIPSGLTLDAEINWIPLLDAFQGGWAGYLKNMVWNIILFLPLGILSPALWRKYGAPGRAALLGLKLSGLIELLQLFTFRLTDVDDLIANTAGAFLGCCLAAPLFARIPGLRSAASEREDALPVLLTATLAVAVLPQPVLSRAIWEWLL